MGKTGVDPDGRGLNLQPTFLRTDSAPGVCTPRPEIGLGQLLAWGVDKTWTYRLARPHVCAWGSSLVGRTGVEMGKRVGWPAAKDQLPQHGHDLASNTEESESS